MIILNEELQFHNLGVEVRDSFVGHVARKELFQIGTTLVRVVSLWTNSFSGSFCVSEANYLLVKSYAQSRKIELRDAVREVLALPPRFNPNIDLGIRIVLGQPMYGFVGKVASQKEGAKFFPGGLEQIFIPNISKGRENKISIYEKY